MLRNATCDVRKAYYMLSLSESCKQWRTVRDLIEQLVEFALTCNTNMMTCRYLRFVNIYTLYIYAVVVSSLTEHIVPEPLERRL